MSFCPASGNSGFVHLAGPLQPSEVNAITVSSYFPLTLSFAPRSPPPTLLHSNQLDVDSSHTCVYLGRRFHLISVQLAAPLHKGYILPGERPTLSPTAEIVLTYAPSAPLSSDQDRSLEGILLCLPLYESGTPAYDSYLDQLVNDIDIACGYENQVGKAYEGADQKTLRDSSLRECVKACCDDAQCLAYTFGKGTCHIKHSVPNLLSTGDETISGKIRRDPPSACSPSPSSDTSTLSAPLSSLFYLPNGNTTHAVMAYKTCFESVRDRKAHRNTVYVLVFPKGVRMRPASVQQLLLRMNGVFPPYRVPPAIRQSGKTLLRYRMENGQKMPLQGSDEGEVYTTTVSTCTEEFQERFEHFLLPSSSSSSSSSSIEEGFQTQSSPVCPPRPMASYKCTPYKKGTKPVRPYRCVPLENQSNRTVAFQGGVPLDTILEEKAKAMNRVKSKETDSTVAGLSMEQIEGIVGGTIGGILLLVVAIRMGTYFLNRRTD